MIFLQLKKIGNEYIITVPLEEVERQHLQEGQFVAVEMRPLSDSDAPEDLREAFEASWAQNEAGYHYLEGR